MKNLLLIVGKSMPPNRKAVNAGVHIETKNSTLYISRHANGNISSSRTAELLHAAELQGTVELLRTAELLLRRSMHTADETDK